ncbi:MAG: hypothetical protein H7Y22_12160 [Gemmatimonadaceae bacterium]|nr:hypothetical protein [Gloeobacterales cyanobacterium ES-bin-141]
MSAWATWLTWLEDSPPGLAMRQSPWLYPVVEITHILGFVILVGAVVMFDLRLLGLSRKIPVAALAEHLLPWAHLSFALVALSGVMLFASDARAIGVSPVFYLKLALIAAAGFNAAAFHIWFLKSVPAWEQNTTPPPVVRAIAVFSVVLWVAVIACGRLIAYF